MKKKLLKSIYSSIILSALVACSNEVPEVPVEQGILASSFDTKAKAQLEKVVIADGVVKFKDGEALCAAILNPEIVNTAKLNSNNTNFKTLGSKYIELEKSYNLMVVNKEVEGGKSTIDDSIENRVRSRILADFLNEDGIMIVGDSAVKVIGDYAYSTSINNYNKLSQLTENELRSYKNVSVNRIIEPLVSDDSAIQTKGSSGGKYERSPVFILTNNSKRREHVTFNAYLLNIANAQTEIVVEMEGIAQIKQILGIWGGSFSDEMVWGEIHLNSGSWEYNPPPAGGYPIPVGTNYFVTGLKARSFDNCFCGWAQILGNTGGVSRVKASITYKAKKSAYQPSDWAGEYTNNYTSIN
jgi:hypothetical protein